jgi:hypothetical protein
MTMIASLSLHGVSAVMTIERCWSQFKPDLPQAKARTHEVLATAIEAALATITETETHGWVTPCGYA